MNDESKIESARYRAWSEGLRPAWFSAWPIARTGLALVLRRKLFWLLLGLALFQFLFLFAMIYLKAQIRVENPSVSRFVDNVLSSVAGAGRTYRDFMAAQGTVTMLLLALAGEILVGNDYRHGGLVFFLSRRVARRHYVAGKLLSIALLVELTTAVPALILYLEYGLLTESMTYFVENTRIVWGILGYGLVMSVTLSLMLLALGSWLPRTVPLVMAWSCVFVLLPMFGAILRSAYGDRRWLVFSLWQDMRLIGSWCFGPLDPGRESPLVAGAIAAVVAVCAASAVAIVPRVRAIKVVS